jgi:ubiquinone/menaquinone biosynthesis C-methylase UbiE
MKKVMNSTELKLFWDTFQKNYEKNIGLNIHPPYLAMCNISKITEKKSILELSVGPGTGLYELCNLLKNKSCQIYGTDISSNMLDASYKRLQNNPNINLFYQDKVVNNNSSLSINLQECDNENLKNFQDDMFDVVISNFSLHLVSSPENMLKESSRVLKNNGISVFSIWGRPEFSQYFTIIPNVMKKLNIPLPEMRTNFHISKVEKLRQIVMENGYTQFNYCYLFCPFDILKPEDYFYMLDSPNYKPIMDSLSDKEKIDVLNEISKEVDIILSQKEELIGTEALIIACRKGEKLMKPDF